MFKGSGFAAGYEQTDNGDLTIDSQSLPSTLYSLQINTYVYESAALRAYENLPPDLQSDGFVYLTDGGYFTLRIGQAVSRDDLQIIETRLLRMGYDYLTVRSDPSKITMATGEAFQASEPISKFSTQDGVVLLTEDAGAIKVKVSESIPVSQRESSAADSSGQNDHKPLVRDSLYEEVLTDPRISPNDKNLLNLSLTDAIRMAIDQNSDIKIASFLPSIAEEERKSTRTVYDPTLFAENNISRTDHPIQSKLEIGTVGSDNFVEDKWDFRAGIQQPLPTGGLFSLSVLDVDHLDSSSDLVIPNPQYTSRLTLELQQALLKEFGDQTNHSAMEIADLNMEISSMEFQKTLANVIREVGTYYWRLVYYDMHINISRKYLQDAEDIYQKLVYRNESGLADLLDVDRAEASVHERTAILIKANTEYELAMDQLRFLLGFVPNFLSCC